MAKMPQKFEDTIATMFPEIHVSNSLFNSLFLLVCTFQSIFIKTFDVLKWISGPFNVVPTRISSKCILQAEARENSILNVIKPPTL